MTIPHVLIPEKSLVFAEEQLRQWLGAHENLVRFTKDDEITVDIDTDLSIRIENRPNHILDVCKIPCTLVIRRGSMTIETGFMTDQSCIRNFLDAIDAYLMMCENLNQIIVKLVKIKRACSLSR